MEVSVAEAGSGWEEGPGSLELLEDRPCLVFDVPGPLSTLRRFAMGRIASALAIRASIAASNN